MQFDRLSKQVIGLAIEVHRELGPGLLESTYEACLVHELGTNGIKCVKQMELPINYKGLELDGGYRVDVLVEDALIIELKSVDTLQRIHEAQLLTYMKLSQIKTGLLINFNEQLLKNGLRRFVL